MITIQNVSKEFHDGVQDYELKINRKLICTFQHKRSDGLVKCLKRAAKAVAESNDVLTKDQILDKLLRHAERLRW